MSHAESDYDVLKLFQHRTATPVSAEVLKAYNEPPKLSSAKYNDILSLTMGPSTLISRPDHIAFYKHLKHSFCKN